jgi:tRNA pseudouridine38-40 synthase
VLQARYVSTHFHARFSAKGKTYRYRIANTAVLSPFELGRAWHVPDRVQQDLLRQAAQLFQGRHDFAAFAAGRGKRERETARTIDWVRIKEKRGLIEIEISGEGFLYKMARMMVGAMVRCAAGKEPIESVALRLETAVRPTAPFVAPACGLYLVSVHYLG